MLKFLELTSGPIVERVSEYEKNAQECRMLARSMNNPEQREQLLKMAEAWERVAVERKRLLTEY